MNSIICCILEKPIVVILSLMFWCGKHNALCTCKWQSGLWVHISCRYILCEGGGPRVVVSTAAFHARVRGSVPGLGGLKETKLFLPHPRVKVSIVGSLRDREVACSASDRQGSNFESCVWRTVSSQSSHHPQEVLLAQFSLYVHKGGLKPDSFHFYILCDSQNQLCWPCCTHCICIYIFIIIQQWLQWNIYLSIDPCYRWKTHTARFFCGVYVTLQIYYPFSR